MASPRTTLPALHVLDGGREAFSSPRILARHGEGSPARIVARRGKSLVFLEANEAWAFEADSRLTFVHCARGRLAIDASLAEVEASLIGHSFVRAHRSWLTNLALVKELNHDRAATRLFVGAGLGEGSGIHVPVSRDRVRLLREALLSGAIGVRRRGPSDHPIERCRSW